MVSPSYTQIERLESRRGLYGLSAFLVISNLPGYLSDAQSPHFEDAADGFEAGNQSVFAESMDTTNGGNPQGEYLQSNGWISDLRRA